MYELIKMAVVGLIVGLLARFILPGRDPMGLIMTAVLGIAGSLIGYFVGQNVLHLSRSASTGWLISIAGAVLLVWLYRLVAGRSQS
jgi:uncharacterized membrane protein YeaQ/YmgE (transglycosylase-associated protein family)